LRNGQEGHKAKVGWWPNAFVAATLAEVILVSYLILVANFRSKVDMVAWIDSVIGCTAECMAGMYLGEASQEAGQEPWAAPAAWASTGQYLVTQVKIWLAAVATRAGGGVDPFIKIFLEEPHLSLNAWAFTSERAASALPRDRPTRGP